MKDSIKELMKDCFESGVIVGEFCHLFILALLSFPFMIIIGTIGFVKGILNIMLEVGEVVYDRFR